ncbi:MAG: cold shock domain-containing protein [Acidimicrobiia bacterium]
MHLLHKGRQGPEGLIAVQGVVKVYDPVTGAGLIVRDDDRSEVYLRPGALQGSIFRTLRQGQRLVFQTEEEDGKLYAREVRFGSDGY